MEDETNKQDNTADLDELENALFSEQYNEPEENEGNWLLDAAEQLLTSIPEESVDEKPDDSEEQSEQEDDLSLEDEESDQFIDRLGIDYTPVASRIEKEKRAFNAELYRTQNKKKKREFSNQKIQNLMPVQEHIKHSDLTRSMQMHASKETMAPFAGVETNKKSDVLMHAMQADRKLSEIKKRKLRTGYLNPGMRLQVKTHTEFHPLSMFSEEKNDKGISYMIGIMQMAPMNMGQAKMDSFPISIMQTKMTPTSTNQMEPGRSENCLHEKDIATQLQQQSFRRENEQIREKDQKNKKSDKRKDDISEYFSSDKELQTEVIPKNERINKNPKSISSDAVSQKTASQINTPKRQDIFGLKSSQRKGIPEKKVQRSYYGTESHHFLRKQALKNKRSESLSQDLFQQKDYSRKAKEKPVGLDDFSQKSSGPRDYKRETISEPQRFGLPSLNMSQQENKSRKMQRNQIVPETLLTGSTAHSNAIRMSKKQNDRAVKAYPKEKSIWPTELYDNKKKLSDRTALSASSMNPDTIHSQSLNMLSRTNSSMELSMRSEKKKGNNMLMESAVKTKKGDIRE